MTIQIIIEDHVVPLLLTSAIEAYEIGDFKSERNNPNRELETYGLLWGYSLPARAEIDQPERLVAVTATIETSAIRRKDSVSPSNESIIIKRDFVRKYWPQLELIGTFHSHPYENLTKVTERQGWRGSPIYDDGSGDKAYWPYFHEKICPEMPTLAHLVVTICALEKQGTAWPSRLNGGEAQTGYVLSADRRKLWIKGYTTERFQGESEDESDDSYELTEDVLLDIPSLQQKFV